MSLSVVLVDKTGTLTPLKIKEFNEADLYKKCGFKKPDQFKKLHEWSTADKTTLCVYGKLDGKAGMENKYDFPPPLDNIIIYGTCVIVAMKNEKWTHLLLDQWARYHEKLFGGFEDLTVESDEDEDEDEEDEYDDIAKTKTGYAKDGFVVSDSDSDNLPMPPVKTSNSNNNSNNNNESDLESIHSDSSSSTVENEIDELDVEADEDVEIEDVEADDVEADEDEAEVDEDEVDEDVEADVVEVEEEDLEEDLEDDLDDDDDGEGVKKRKSKATKKGKKVATKKKVAVAIDLAALEKNELMSEGYLSTDDEYE